MVLRVVSGGALGRQWPRGAVAWGAAALFGTSTGHLRHWAALAGFLVGLGWSWSVPGCHGTLCGRRVNENKDDAITCQQSAARVPDRSMCCANGAFCSHWHNVRRSNLLQRRSICCRPSISMTVYTVCLAALLMLPKHDFAWFCQESVSIVLARPFFPQVTHALSHTFLSHPALLRISLLHTTLSRTPLQHTSLSHTHTHTRTPHLVHKPHPFHTRTFTHNPFSRNFFQAP